MSKRGVTRDEKRTRMMEIFHESKDVFTLKNLESIAPKQKGIIQQSVKEILQSLVDDNMVVSDKVGINTVFWSFPSHDSKIKKNQVEKLEKEVEAIKRKYSDMKAECESGQIGREDTEERRSKIARISDLESENSALKRKLSEQSANDPEILEKLVEETKIAIEAANRWSDNVTNLRTYCSRKFNLDGCEFDKNFRIPGDFYDYIE
eukprot:TRINITY_DN13656_c0_g1_i1.p1 TRINITY_DN13656_c0_g1~~TRINITY_DN13656_c0_g1_i1.p1  ORF type:complete len:217 (+),score=73.89 TRINITY_DN13656_c0_g1_i1:36-653(+)